MSEINDFKDNRIQWRTSLLATIWAGISLMTIYSWFNSTAGKREVKSFSFPDRVSLNSWQLVKTETLPLENFKTLTEDDRIASAKHYSYLKNGVPLEIEMLYLVGTKGNLPELIKKQTGISQEVIDNADLGEIRGIGSYILYSDRDRAYLSACINSRGNTTVTAQQFSHNRYTQDFKYNLVLPWLQGKDSIRDLRCLWVKLSIPREESSQPEAYQSLTKAWIDWYHWWQPRFPGL
jgi:cyanosortase A-associated protein